MDDGMQELWSGIRSVAVSDSVK